MTKNEFLEELRLALSGEVSEEEMVNQIKFYDEYIRNNSGNKSEETVTTELGNPRLIAKTIIDTYQRSYGPMYRNTGRKSYQEQYSTYEQKSNKFNDQNNGSDYGQSDGNHHTSWNINRQPWYLKTILMIVLFFIILILLIFGGIFLRVLFTFAMPILILLFIIQLLRRL